MARTTIPTTQVRDGGITVDDLASDIDAVSKGFNADKLDGNHASAFAAAVHAHSVAQVPAGTVLSFAGSSAPTGFLECDGSAVSRSTYSDLFTAIGTTWGAGNGSTTFNLPDLRGRAVIGVGTGSGLTARSLGSTGGFETHTLTTTEMPSHTHGIGSNDGTPAGGVNAFRVNTDSGTINTDPAGGGGAHNNMQPWAALKQIIKT